MLSQNYGMELGRITSMVDKDTFTFVMTHGDMLKKPYLGDYVIVISTFNENEIKWLGFVAGVKEIVLDENENQVKNIITKSELSQEECNIYLGTEYTCKLVGMFADNEVTPVVRYLPQRTAKVMYPTYDELVQIASIDSQGAEIGSLVVGGVKVYGVSTPVQWKNIKFKFSGKRIEKRRTAIFGQSGYGKSNLTKNLIVNYALTHPKSSIFIFDRSGEYGTDNPQSKSLNDVDLLKDRIVIYKMADEKLNLCKIESAKIVEYFFNEREKESAAADHFYFFDDNAREKVITCIANALARTEDWNHVVNILAEELSNSVANRPDIVARSLRKILGKIVAKYHNSNSNLPDKILNHLAESKIVVFNFANVADDYSNRITRYIVGEVLDTNSKDFNRGMEPSACLFLVEEAQNFLSDQQVKNSEDTVVRLAKEGRKYNLGLIYVTQQPSAIADEILSQTNNIFSLHLLTNADTNRLCSLAPQLEFIKDYIQREPIRGLTYIYSNVYDEKGLTKPFPVVISADVELFDNVVEKLNKEKAKYTVPIIALDFTKEVRDTFEDVIKETYRHKKETITWPNLWRDVNNRLSNNNPYKNRYGKGKPYPSLEMIRSIENEFDDKVMDIDGETVRIIIKRKEISNMVECYLILPEIQDNQGESNMNEQIESLDDFDLPF